MLGEGEASSSSEGLVGVQWAAEGEYSADGGGSDDDEEAVFETILHWQWVRVGAARTDDVCAERRKKVVSSLAGRLLDSMLADGCGGDGE
jgi:hypothetical protein